MAEMGLLGLSMVFLFLSPFSILSPATAGIAEMSTGMRDGIMDKKSNMSAHAQLPRGQSNSVPASTISRQFEQLNGVEPKYYDESLLYNDVYKLQYFAIILSILFNLLEMKIQCFFIHKKSKIEKGNNEQNNSYFSIHGIAARRASPCMLLFKNWT
ncbi:hypothetical protein ACJX0J_005711 [Zea mays]